MAVDLAKCFIAIVINGWIIKYTVLATCSTGTSDDGHIVLSGSSSSYGFVSSPSFTQSAALTRSTPFTGCIWEKPTLPNAQQFFSIGSGADGDPGAGEGECVFLRYDASWAIRFGFYANDLTSSTFFTSDAGTWNHVCASFDGTNRIIYRNAVNVANDVPTSFYSVTGPLGIGTFKSTSGTQSSAAFSQFFNGALDEFRFYTSALSSSAISSGYTSNIWSTAHLVLYYPFNDQVGSVASNHGSTGSVDALTLASGVTWMRDYTLCLQVTPSSSQTPFSSSVTPSSSQTPFSSSVTISSSRTPFSSSVIPSSSQTPFSSSAAAPFSYVCIDSMSASPLYNLTSSSLVMSPDACASLCAVTQRCAGFMYESSGLCTTMEKVFYGQFRQNTWTCTYGAFVFSTASQEAYGGYLVTPLDSS